MRSRICVPAQLGARSCGVPILGTGLAVPLLLCSFDKEVPSGASPVAILLSSSSMEMQFLIFVIVFASSCVPESTSKDEAAHYCLL